MSIMYCNFNMFDMASQVLCVEEGKESYTLFTGTFEDVSEFIAGEYQTHKYNKIVLSGPYAFSLADRIRAYALVNYNNVENLNIEVIN